MPMLVSIYGGMDEFIAGLDDELAAPLRRIRNEVGEILRRTELLDN